MSQERLQKVLARAGVASRRAAEALITAGRVRVDGRVVTELGTKVDPRSAKVEVDGKRVLAEDLVYVLLHKPRNVVSTMSDPEGRPSVRENLAPVPGRVYPVGRLDFATSGALLATNDGDFAAVLLHPRKAVPKTYVVKVQGEMDEPDFDRWRRGVELDDGKTQPAKASLLRHEEGKTWFELTITEGRNQQIRRMGDATGFRVMRLARLAFAGVTTEALPPGAWRYLTRDELTAIRKTYGVPQRVVSPPAGEPPPRAPRAPQRPRGGFAGKPDAAPGGGATAGRTSGPRYGGGAPVRRGVDVRRDWGGGIRRGASGPEEDASGQGEARDERGGRGGRTRTTGTGGGVGASRDAPSQGRHARPARGSHAGGSGTGGGDGGESTYRVRGRRGG